MKKISFHLCLKGIAILILLSQNTFAQVRAGQFEIAGSSGVISALEMTRGLDQGLSGDNAPEYDNGGTFNFVLTGKYFFHSRIAIGLSVGMQTINGSSNTELMSPSAYNYSVTYYHFCPEMTFIYINQRWFRFYALTGAGVSLAHQQNNYYEGSSQYPGSFIPRTSWITPNVQFTPLGFGFGDRVKWTLELGLGYKGLVSTGLAFTIGDKKNDWWKGY